MVKHEIGNQIGYDVIDQYSFYEDFVVLMWMFDGVGEDEGMLRKILVAKLTHEEYEKIQRRDSTKVGLLEPIRERMTYPDAIVMRISKEHFYVDRRSFSIPSQGDEEFFLNILDTHSDLDRATMGI